MHTRDIGLRELQPTDLQVLTRWRNDHEVVASLGSAFRYIAPSVDEAWYEAYLKSRANNVRLAVCTHDGAMIGVVYLLDVDWVSRDAEVAILIGDTTSQGKGYGEQAMRLAVHHAFSDLNLERLHLAVLVHNERAIRLYHKLGFLDEGVQRKAAFKQGRRQDVLLMGLLRDEYVSHPPE